MKKFVILGLLIMVLSHVGGCRDGSGMQIDFESYNELENPLGENGSGIFPFEMEHERYELLNGHYAEIFGAIEEGENNRYKLVLVDSDRQELFTTITEKQYQLKAIRECTDIDGTMYLLYSKWDPTVQCLYLDDLKSTHILQMDMNNYTMQQEYIFPKEVIVLSIYDGYVYTIENGRIYRSLLQDGTDKECMADLGYRGIPTKEKIDTAFFYTKADGIVVKMWRTGEGEEIIAADFKYTDSPMEPNVLRRIHRAVMEEVTTE